MVSSLKRWLARRSYQNLVVNTSGCFCEGECSCDKNNILHGLYARGNRDRQLRKSGFKFYRGSWGVEVWINDRDRMKVRWSHDFGR